MANVSKTKLGHKFSAQKSNTLDNGYGEVIVEKNGEYLTSVHIGDYYGTGELILTVTDKSGRDIQIAMSEIMARMDKEWGVRTKTTHNMKKVIKS